jgi:hypothetical protein
MAGRAVACAAPPVEAAREAAELTALLAPARSEDSAARMLEEALGPALAATELKLASCEERLPATDERTLLAEAWRDEAALLAPEAAELIWEPAAEVAEATADEAPPMMEEAPPTTEETSPRMEETRPPCAAAPAAKTEVAMMEKRILIELLDCVGEVGRWKLFGLMRASGLTVVG